MTFEQLNLSFCVIGNSCAAAAFAAFTFTNHERIAMINSRNLIDTFFSNVSKLRLYVHESTLTRT